LSSIFAKICQYFFLQRLISVLERALDRDFPARFSILFIYARARDTMALSLLCVAPDGFSLGSMASPSAQWLLPQLDGSSAVSSAVSSAQTVHRDLHVLVLFV
jgi:hypothetical protein